MAHPQKNQPAASDELSETAQFLDNLRVKAMAGFITILMVLYSFFGSIYRIPTQMEQHGKEIVVLQTTSDKAVTRLIEIEKILAANSDTFTEVQRSRERIEAIEKREASRSTMQQQVDKLEEATRELAKLLDSTSLRLSELNINVGALKETTTETRRALEELKRK